MVGLHILMHTYNLSDEEVCERWLESPHFQHFTGEEYVCHALPARPPFDDALARTWHRDVR